jgi:hypothetical protein
VTAVIASHVTTATETETVTAANEATARPVVVAATSIIDRIETGPVATDHVTAAPWSCRA